MKRITLFLVTVLFTFNLQAQSCVPLEGLPDTLIGVVPLPFEPESNPTGGISDTACLNELFEFTFTIVVPEEFDPGTGTPVGVISIDLATEGAVTNIPDAFDYVCDPPNCIFPKDSTGCVLLFGTPEDPEDVGVWDLEIAGTVRTGFLDLNLTFPNPLLFDGNYFLHVKEEGQCMVSSVEELATKVRMTNVPNPFSSYTQILVNSDEAGAFDFQVRDLMGKAVHNERVQILEGANTIDFDASNLANGIYIYSISNGTDVVSKKMVLNRR